MKWVENEKRHTGFSIILILIILPFIPIFIVMRQFWDFYIISLLSSLLSSSLLLCSHRNEENRGNSPCICTPGAASLSRNRSNTCCRILSRYSGVLWSVILLGRTSSS